MMDAPDPSKAIEIMKLEAEKNREQTKLNMATTRMAWSDAKKHATRLEEIDAELVAARTRPTETNIVGNFKARG
jgi:hypothetical protein